MIGDKNYIKTMQNFKLNLYCINLEGSSKIQFKK